MVIARPLSSDPNGPGFGAELRDVDLAAFDPKDLAAVVAALHDHRWIVVRDQYLGPPQFAALARCFGRPQPHIKSELRHRECPEILPLSNIFEGGKAIGIFDGAAYWHTDMSYEAEPASATLVHALEVPEAGGDTLIADMAGAWDALPAEEQARIEDLMVLHHYGNRDDPVDDSRTSATPLTEAQKRQAGDVFHPLVLPHPVTGRRALYGVAGASFGIVGMPEPEALALLEHLKRHATQDRFVARHSYRVGDLVIWDNYATLHSATLIEPAAGQHDRRLLHRISVKGLPGETAAA